MCEMVNPDPNNSAFSVVRKGLRFLISSRGRRFEKPADSDRNGSNIVFLLQVFGQLSSVLADAAVSLHLVEVSPALSRIQAEKLTRTCSHETDDGDSPVYLSGESATGLPVSWYRCLEDVPAGTRGEVLWAGVCGCLTPRVCLQVSASSWLTSSLTLFLSTSSR